MLTDLAERDKIMAKPISMQNRLASRWSDAPAPRRIAADVSGFAPDGVERRASPMSCAHKARRNPKKFAPMPIASGSSPADAYKVLKTRGDGDAGGGGCQASRVNQVLRLPQPEATSRRSRAT